MTPQRAKELLPIITAFAEGRTVQYESIFDGWVDIESHADWNNNKYRIKPSPKLRPWKAEEVPVGALIRFKRESWVSIIVGRNNRELSVPLFNNGHTTHNFDSLQDFEHSLDNGKTWLPCGVMGG